MSAELRARQQALVLALGQREPGLAGLRPLPGIEGGIGRGLLAYRLNAQALSAKALGSVFAQLRQALGEADFDAMAWVFWRWAPPEQGDLARWGGRLAEFLAAQEGMDPVLCDLARLEWALHQAERAADAELDLASLDLLASEDPGQLGLRMRPGVALLERQSGSGPVLVWRQGWKGRSRPLGAGEAALMRVLLEGGDLAAALDAAAVTEDTDFDFAVWLQTALRDACLQAAFIVTNKV